MYRKHLIRYNKRDNVQLQCLHGISRCCMAASQYFKLKYDGHGHLSLSTFPLNDKTRQDSLFDMPAVRIIRLSLTRAFSYRNSPYQIPMNIQFGARRSCEFVIRLVDRMSENKVTNILKGNSVVHWLNLGKHWQG